MTRYTFLGETKSQVSAGACSSPEGTTTVPRSHDAPRVATAPAAFPVFNDKVSLIRCLIKSVTQNFGKTTAAALKPNVLVL